MGRGIRLGLARCAVCGGAHERDAALCTRCARAVVEGDRTTLVALSLENLVGRFGPIIRKEPGLHERAVTSRIDDLVAAASERASDADLAR